MCWKLSLEEFCGIFCLDYLPPPLTFTSRSPIKSQENILLGRALSSQEVADVEMVTCWTVISVNLSMLPSKYISKGRWSLGSNLLHCSGNASANSRINYVKQVSYLPGKHLTQSRTALEMSLFKEKLLQRDTDQSMNKFPKDMEMYA